jgi:hypothetical protein
MNKHEPRAYNLVMRKILSFIFGGIETLFTGGKYGSSVPSPHSYDEAKQQERRQKEFAKFGTHSCKICKTKIPGNKSYCGACYFKYKK